MNLVYPQSGTFLFSLNLQNCIPGYSSFVQKEMKKTNFIATIPSTLSFRLINNL